MLVRPSLAFAGEAAPDPEPWGKAVCFSTLGHAALLFCLLFFSFGERPLVQTIVTDVSFLEREPLPVETAARAEGGPAAMDGGGGTQLGVPGKAEPMENHSSLPPVPYSSPSGTPDGDVVTDLPMGGPIVPLADISIVGARKASLAPLAGRTEGRKPKGPISVPTGSGAARETPIALAREDLAQIRKKEKGLGAPAASRGIVGGGGEGRIHRLAAGAAGRGKELPYEPLKSNPSDAEKWGKQKGPFSMEGPLKYRKILKMELPPYPRWAEEQGLEASVSFRLWVDPKGRVKDNLYLEKASGSSELDALAKEALRKFVFVPIPSGQAQEDEWGVATFRFELKRGSL